jgi:hypothetical protein
MLLSLIARCVSTYGRAAGEGGSSPHAADDHGTTFGFGDDDGDDDGVEHDRNTQFGFGGDDDGEDFSGGSSPLVVSESKQ